MSEKPIRILLSKTTSDMLTAAGEDCFIVVCRAMRGTDEDSAGRWALHLGPVSMKTAQAACRVLAGEMVARKAPRPKI